MQLEKWQILKSPSRLWLVVTLGLVGAMPFAFYLGPTSWPMILFFGLLLSIFSAIGFWIGFGESWFRFLYCPLAIVGLALFIIVAVGVTRGSINHLQLAFSVYTTLGAITAITVATPILLFRGFGNGRLVRLGGGEYSNPPEAIQFRILHVLILTSGVALLMVLGKWMTPMYQAANSPWAVITKFGLTLGLSSVVVVWATLGTSAIIRTFVSVAVGTGMTIVNYYFIGFDGTIYAWITIIAWIHSTILFWLVRYEGYRFVRMASQKTA